MVARKSRGAPNAAALTAPVWDLPAAHGGVEATVKARLSVATEPIGPRMRRMEAWARPRFQKRLKNWRRRIGIPLLDLARILWYAPRLSPKVARQFGISVSEQIAIQCRLAFRKGVDPSVYYFLELFKAGGIERVDQLVLRREIKGMLLSRLHRLQPPVDERRINLGDKLQLFAWCTRAGLPHCPPLMLIEDGRSVWQSPNMLDFDQVLFAKPRVGRGACGVSLYRRVEAFQYLDRHGKHLQLGGIVSEIVRRSGRRNIMILPRLRNHPALADMASESLITIRAVTCLDEKLRPELVLAYLRVLTKLEPDWPVEWPITEYASAIDLRTGRLSAMTGDQPESLWRWHEHHPVTGALVTGRPVPCWDQVVALAEQAHRLTSDRVLVGWDIAITPQGPTLLEGNSYPDVHYPQRLHRRPFGEMRIGELLRFNLDRLEAHWDAEYGPRSAGPV